MFGFYDPIKYLDSDVKFPDSRVLTGKFLGFEPEKGDTLVYRILPDHTAKGEATHYLVRSVVEPDTMPNFRTGLMRNLPPQMEPFDKPPKPPRQSSRLSKDNNTEPLLSLRRQNLDQNNPFTKGDKDWDFMDKMEFLDPWNPKDDPWAIHSIKDHRDSKERK